ncbi:Uncharacterised protein [Acinetobacter baumannii]|nr:Uncharacterised protein [Acinetobacter baumannii]
MTDCRRDAPLRLPWARPYRTGWAEIDSDPSSQESRIR